MKKFGGEVDDKYIDFLNETFKGPLLKEALDTYYGNLEETIRQPDASNIDASPRICNHLDGEECLSESPCDACRFENEKEAMSLVYRINIRPLWKNNSPRVYWPLCHQIAEILLDETGKAPWYEPTTKCFKFRLAVTDAMKMKTVIALQAIGYNNGGYVLSISKVL